MSVTEVPPPVAAPHLTMGSAHGLSVPRPQGRRSGAAVVVLTKAVWSRIGAVHLGQFVVAVATTLACGATTACGSVYIPPSASVEALQAIFDETESWVEAHPTMVLSIAGDLTWSCSPSTRVTDRRPAVGPRHACVHVVADFAQRLGAVAVEGCGGHRRPTRWVVGLASAAAQSAMCSRGERMHVSSRSIRVWTFCVFRRHAVVVATFDVRTHAGHTRTHTHTHAPAQTPRTIRSTPPPDWSKVDLTRLDATIAGELGLSAPP